MKHLGQTHISIIEGIYHHFTDNAVAEVDAPAHYSWAYTMDILGSYYKNAQFDFLDSKGDTVVRYDTYSLVEHFPKELLEGYPVKLVHNVTLDKWYLFGEPARESIGNLFGNAETNGFVKVISNTIV